MQSPARLWSALPADHESGGFSLPRSLSRRRGENLVGMIKEKGQKSFEGSNPSLSAKIGSGGVFF
jgi:hypothetical protein